MKTNTRPPTQDTCKTSSSTRELDTVLGTLRDKDFQLNIWQSRSAQIISRSSWSRQATYRSRISSSDRDVPILDHLGQNQRFSRRMTPVIPNLFQPTLNSDLMNSNFPKLNKLSNMSGDLMLYLWTPRAQ